MTVNPHRDAAAKLELALRKRWPEQCGDFSSVIHIDSDADGVNVFVSGDPVANWVRNQNPWALAAPAPVLLVSTWRPRR